MKNSKFLKQLLIILFLTFTTTSFGQMLEPDDPGSDPVGEDPLGGGAPVGSGIVFLLTLGTIYGGKKAYNIRRAQKK
jgi:hypothetical protein